jgi:hypothetical protein
MKYPTLDAHGHITPTRPADELAGCGAVLAMSISLEEAAPGGDRRTGTRQLWPETFAAVFSEVEASDGE